MDEEQFGTTITRELRSGGAKMQVTDENKEEYIQEVINWRFVNRVKDQVRKEGRITGSFHSIPGLSKHLWFQF